VENGHGNLRFQRVNAPDIEEIREIVHAISHRVVRFLEKRGFLERDAQSSYLALEPDDDDAMAQLQGHSIPYRIAVGPQQGRKVFTLQTLPPDEDESGGSDRVAKEAGFSLHAGVSTEAHQRDKLERLCRYVTRPAVSERRLAITSNGNIRYQPWAAPLRHLTATAPRILYSSGAAIRRWTSSRSWPLWFPSPASI
jgi:hypothetical protein